MLTPDWILDLGKDFSIHFGALLEIVGENAKPKEPALVLVAGDRSQWKCEGYMGGQDVELVIVRPKVQIVESGVKEGLTYRKDIAGSDLVYDLTGRFLQGKARPFECDLSVQLVRLYALLPFQVEGLSVIAKQQAGNVSIEMEYQNALNQRVKGALPCYAELRQPNGMVVWGRYLATSVDGHLKTAAELPREAPRGKWSLVVRSELDGKQVTLPVEVDSFAGK